MKITLETSLADSSEKFAASKDYTEECRESIPGAYSRVSFNYGPHAIFVERGEGAYIHTIDGHRLLDLNNNFTVNILGHNHPKISAALMDAIPQGISFGNPVKNEKQLADILRRRVQSVEKVKFSCSASESCLSAARIARAHTGKTKIAKFEGGYHGFIDALQISAHPPSDPLAGPDELPNPVADSAGIPDFTIDNTIILPQNDLASCERILRENAADTACVIMELQSGAGGVVVLDKDFVAAIRELTSELGIVMIVDETITLRADVGGLQQWYDVEPDLTVMGKIIGGGLPLGAVGGKAEFFDGSDNGDVHLSGTHHGHPLAIVAGIACLEVMDQAAHDRLNAMAARIKTELNSWANENGHTFAVYGDFSFFGYAFTDTPGRQISTHRDFWRYTNDDHILTFALEMANQGFFPVHRGQIALSLVMTDEDITSFITATKEIVTGILA